MANRSTPLADRIAQACGIDLANLSGSGCDGRILAADVQRAATQALVHSPAAMLVPIASASLELDASAALQRAASLSAQIGAAVGELLTRHPALNASWTAAGIVRQRQIRLPGRAPDTDPASFGLQSLAEGGAWHSAPALPVGAVAALGIGAARQQVIAYGAGIAIRQIAIVTLSYDARAIDHRQAVAFLRDLREMIEAS